MHRISAWDRYGFWMNPEDFAGSPLHADDSDETLRALIGFLTLRPGDTDPEYFEHYTERQRQFCDQDAEALSIYADELCGEPLQDTGSLRRSPGPPA